MSTVVEFGIKGRSPGYAFATSDYDQAQALLVFEGRLLARIADIPYAATPGMLLWLPRGSAFTLSCSGRGYRGVFAIARNGDLPTGTACLVAATPQLLAVADAMRAPSDGSHEAQAHLATAFLVLAGSAHPDATRGDAWAERLRVAIEAHLGDQMPVHRLCDDWPISYRQLARRFHATHSLSPKAFQLERRLLRARERLLATSASITEVALDLGFASSQHFASRFRHRFGQTPRATRDNPAHR